MKRFFLFLIPLLLFPLISDASAVPKWYKANGLSYYFDSLNVASTTDPLLYFVPPASSNYGSVDEPSWNFLKNQPCLSTYIGLDSEVPCVLLPDDVLDGSDSRVSNYSVVYTYSTTDPSSVSNYYDWWTTSWYSYPSYSNAIGVELVSRSSYMCNYVSFVCPSTVYFGVGLKPDSSGVTDYDDFIPIAYWELNLQSGSFGNSPIYTINTDIGDNIFPAFNGPGSPEAVAFNLKQAISNNTVVPDCDFSDFFTSDFWTDCVARSIFNWLFIPSDSAIDTLVAVSSNPDFGRTWSYVVLAPVFTSTLVQACPLENPSTCDIGADYLTIPILDVYGSSTPYEIVPDVLIPAYFDAFLASILQVLIIVSLSYILISRFL